VVTALTLTAATVLASFLPAIRAMRIQPVAALRYE
jgi:ABC-type lipoprotein release transport system permease subunit